MKKMMVFVLLAAVTYLVNGCAPVVVGGAATGVYKAGTDERTIGRMLDDSSITVKVNSELTNEPMVKARYIDVDTLDGVVTLTGMVESQEVMERAVAAAGRAPGVVKVKNNLMVGKRTMGRMVDDGLLASKIKVQLMKEPGIRSLNIDIDVYNGIVTLTGMMASAAEKEKVIDIARTTAGTVKVVDNIKLK
jgi:hyperosmotically inducible protein